MSRRTNVSTTDTAGNGASEHASDATSEQHNGGAADPLAEFNPAEPLPPDGIPDPETELDAYKSVAPVEALTRRPARVTALQIRKPNDQEYIRVMPGAELLLPLFRDKTQGDKLYLFRPEVEPYLPPKAIRNYRIVLARSLRAITPFIWCLPVPQDDMGRTWHESLEAAARDAERLWTKVVSDQVGGCYVSYPAAAELPEPEWPTEPFNQLVLLAFKNQRIDKPDHPVIRRLNGEIA